LFGDIDCAVLVDPHDPAAIGSALQSLLEDSTAAVAMGRRGRSAAESRYSWAADEPKLLACYAAVLASARRSRSPDTDPMSLQSSVRKIREQPWP
jgi:glycosyltransferase involved in cell wall biosynthesis